MKKTLCTITILILMWGCKSSKPVLTNSTERVKDSIVTTIKVLPKKQKVTVPSDSISFVVPIKELKARPIVKTSSTGRTKGSIAKVGDSIHVECFTEEYEAIVEAQSILIEKLISQFKQQKQELTKTETRSHPIVKGLAYIGGLTLLVLGYKLVSKLKPL